jgi:hypothetical protein
VDRYDAGEFAGIAGLVWFAFLCWPPAAVLVASLGLLVEVNMRAAGRSPVRGARPVSRLAAVARAGRAAWRAPDAA